MEFFSSAREKALLFGAVVIISACALVMSSCEPAPTSSSVEERSVLNTLSSAEAEAGWILAFDGETLNGWRGLGREGVPDGHWVAEDGAIRKVAQGEVPRADDGQPVAGGDILFDRPFEHFEMTFEWKVSLGANSGIKYNVSEEFSTAHDPPHAALGFEYQILDDDEHPDASNDPNRLAAGLYDLIPPSSDVSLRPVGAWNDGKILFQGNRGEHWLNGQKALEYQLDTYMMDRLLATSKWHDMPEFGTRRERGYIVLQDHGDDVWFRNIKIRPLPPQ